MLSKCANPACAVPFRYLRDGRLYQIDTADGPRAVTDGKPSQRFEYFWLCGQCAASMTLAFQRGKGVIMVPLPREGERAAAS
jgi:hypothetical protein